MALESFKRINDLDLNPEKDLIQIYNKKTDTMGVINPSQISTPLPAGVLSVDNPLSSTLQPIEDKSGTASALSISTNRVGLASDPSVTTQSSSVIAASTTNASLVIAPNGTGALIADIPDGTATGGDPRGANAVDLQTSRGASNQVAVRDYTVVLGGQSNTSDGDDGRWGVVVGGLNNRQRTAYGVVVGGQSNQTGDGNAANSHIFIGGGSSNYSNGSYSVIAGGRSNTTGNSYSVVSGGQSNTASTNTHATVVGGFSNTSSGSASISGGQSNTASAIRSVALGGFSNTSNLDYAVTLGGLACQATNVYTVSLGNRSLSYLAGQFSVSGGNFTNTQGQSQQSNLTPLREDTLTTGGTTTLSLDGTGTTNLIIPSGTNRMWNVQVRWVAVVTAITGTATGVTVGDTKVSTDLLAVAKRGGVTTVGVHTSAGTSVIETLAGSLTAANITYSAGASQEMAITFTGPTFAGGGSVTMRVVAAISLTEVAY